MKKLFSFAVLLLASVQAFAENVIAKTADRAPSDIANNQLMASGVPAVDVLAVSAYVLNILLIAAILFFVYKNSQMKTTLVPVKKSQ